MVVAKKRKGDLDPKPKAVTKKQKTGKESKSKSRGLPKESAVTPVQIQKVPIELAEPVRSSGFTHSENANPLCKITSWNVNGLRALCKKDVPLEYIKKEEMDILCLQETKCLETDSGCESLKQHLEDSKYHCYWHNGAKKGYSGTMLCSKIKPINVMYGMGEEPMDESGQVISFEGQPVVDHEGRVITAEYENFYLTNVYTPNSGQDLVRLPYREKWDQVFRIFCRKLDSKKPLIVCGDLNCAHKDVDIARPKSNWNKSAGFTAQECDAFTTFLAEGGEDGVPKFVDTFRKLYPDAVEKYTYWGYRFNAKAKNLGWRIDYFLAPPRILGRLYDQTIRANVTGSDHCPLTLHIAL